MRGEYAVDLNQAVKGIMIYCDEKKEHLPAKKERQIGSAVSKRGVHSRSWSSVE